MAYKFRNKPCTCDGFKFASKLERDFYLACVAWKQQGKIYDFKMQVPFKLHGVDGSVVCKYILDFEIYFSSEFIPVKDASKILLDKVEYKSYVEAKGRWTDIARLKKKLFEAEHGPLEIHTSKDPWRP